MIVTFTLDTNVPSDLDALKAIANVKPYPPLTVAVDPVLDLKALGALPGKAYISPFPSQDDSAQTLAGAAKLAPPPAEVAKPSSAFSDEDVANATRDVASTLGEAGILRATALLTEFGVQRARDLPVEKREGYIAAAKKIVTDHKAVQA